MLFPLLLHAVHSFANEVAPSGRSPQEKNRSSSRFLSNDTFALHRVASTSGGRNRSSILASAGCDVVRTAIQAPNMNAFAERWVQTVKRECLSKLILFGAEHLRRALSEFTAHYHEQRPHQGIDNKLINPTTGEPPDGNRVIVDERLGGLLRSYRRSA